MTKVRERCRGLLVLVTGSQDWTDEDIIRAVLLEHDTAWPKKNAKPRLLHGGARGADNIADGIARELGWTVIREPYFGDLGRQGGPARNAFMLEIARLYWKAYFDVVVEAFQLGGTPGTANCIAQARGAGLKLNVRHPKEML